MLARQARQRNVRSRVRWFTEFCNSHYVSHFAALFIVARTKISIVKSCLWFLFFLTAGFSTAVTTQVMSRRMPNSTKYQTIVKTCYGFLPLTLSTIRDHTHTHIDRFYPTNTHAFTITVRKENKRENAQARSTCPSYIPHRLRCFL